MQCIKCSNPNIKLNHSTTCIYYWEVAIDENVISQVLNQIDTKRLKKATIEIGKLFNVKIDKLVQSDISEKIIENVSPRDLAYAISYKFSPVFTKIGKL